MKNVIFLAMIPFVTVGVLVGTAWHMARKGFILAECFCDWVMK